MDIRYAAILTMLLMHGCVNGYPKSPSACSSFDYDIKTLRTVLQMEMKMEQFEKKMDEWGDMMKAVIEKHKSVNEEGANQTSQLRDTVTALKQEAAQMTMAMEEKFEDTRRAIRQELQEESTRAMSGINATLDMILKENEVVLNRGKQVGFTVHSPTGRRKSGSALFKKVVMNVGRHYSTENGVFRCPVSGMYLFSVTVYASRSRSGFAEAYCFVVHNSTNVAIASTSKGEGDSASTTVFIRLSAGDKVKLNCGGWNNIYTDSIYTSFTGALVNAD